MGEENSASLGVHLCEELLELATPDLYRNNLFRVLGVPVHTGPAEVRHRHKKLEMQRKLGLSAEVTIAGIFPLTPPPSPEIVAKAIERMNDPVARFLDEFFWFSAPLGDLGLVALECGNVLEARSHWERLAADPVTHVHAHHNLAVMTHLLALEQPNPDVYASVALVAWQATTASEAFWDRVRARVGEMNDARLTTGFVRRLRDTLPRMKLLIFARQAVAASEQGDTKKTAALLKVIRKSGYGSEIVDEIVREALKPLRSRISAAVASARQQWTKTPQYGIKILRELHQTVQHLLVIHDHVADNDLARQGVHDEVGEAMNQAEVAYCKATNNWVEGEKLLVLAQSVAMGQRLRDQIAENIKIDQENAKNGNNWCAPGYWDLAPEVIADLEKARAHAEAGNFDAALDILLAMDKRIGFPLIRAAAYSMSVKAIRKFNEAIGEFNAEGGVLKKLIESIINKDSGVLLSLMNPPQSYMNTWQLPSCPVCHTSNYTSWTNFTFKNVPMWMCSSCSAKHNSYLESKKRTFVNAISEPMQYLALASKLDPQDPGIRRNKEGIEKVARESGHFSEGDSNALAKKLTKQRVRRTAVTVGDAPTDTCFFCGQRPGDASAAITVPMHGPVTHTEFLFGSGTTYFYGDVAIARCTECWMHHTEWPERIEAWHETALRAAEPDNFPEASAAVANAMQAVETQAKVSALAGQSVERAQAALLRAVQSQGFFARLFGRPNPARDAANAALAAAQQQQQIATRQSQQADDRHKQALTELRKIRKQVVAAYKAANPQPGLPVGIRPENHLMLASAIVTQQQQFWTFGEKPDMNDGEILPKGTVSRSPKLRDVDDDEFEYGD